VIDNIDLPPTLLSRFDLIYLLLDKPAERTDRLLARHLVGLYAARRPAAAAAGAPAGASPSASEAAEALGAEGAPIDQRALTDYISHARQHCHPRLSDEASDLLVSAYVEMRRVGAGRKTISATPRQLESLIRLVRREAARRARLDVCDVIARAATRVLCRHLAAQFSASPLPPSRPLILPTPPRKIRPPNPFRRRRTRGCTCATWWTRTTSRRRRG
jgi:DNA replication licensing factor MCM4